MEVTSVVQPKAPGEKGWFRNLSAERELHALWSQMKIQSVAAIYDHVLGYRVISSVEVATPQRDELNLGPEYHLSISGPEGRCSSQEAAHIIKAFGLEDAKEDNHVPSGFVRNFWRPVADRFSGYECPCQDTEPTIREDKGDFIWRPAPAH